MKMLMRWIAGLAAVSFFRRIEEGLNRADEVIRALAARNICLGGPEAA